MAAAHTVMTIWLIKSPQRYPWMPNLGTAKKTLTMRMKSPVRLMRKVEVVFPRPLMVLKSALLT